MDEYDLRTLPHLYPELQWSKQTARYMITFTLVTNRPLDDTQRLFVLLAGNFSTVYVGTLDDRRVVVKQLFKGEELAFEQELRMYGGLKT